MFSQLSAAVVSIVLAAPIFAEDAIRWKLGNPVTGGDPFTQVLRRYSEAVSVASGGEMEFEIVEITAAGFKSVDSLRVLRQDVVEAMFVFPQYITRDEPLLGAMMPQGGLLAVEDNLKIIDIQEEIAGEILERWAVVPVTRLIDPRSSRMGIVSLEPIHGLRDLRRMKLRHFNKEGIRAFNRIGISTQYIPSHELFMALRMGVVDAAVYSPSYIRSQGLHEVGCCYKEIGIYTLATPSLLVARTEDWDELPDHLKAIMRETGRNLFEQDLEAAMSGAEVKRIEAWLAEHGMVILPPLSEEDRRQVRRALLESWREKCEQLGPQAVRNRQRILDALHDGSTKVTRDAL